MAKRILIFSDGTGQAGGIAFDEDRTNVYKLFRATRCGPDSSVDPNQQIAHYDPGLGSPADGGFMFGKIGRWIYNLASQATGLGLTANIIDCYAALIRNYQDGDRIFLFGFSRGAYTVRCLAAVIAKCGIPRQLPDGSPVPLDVAGSRKLATYAVKRVYQYCSSRPRTAKPSYTNFLLDTRDAIAARFRAEHGSTDAQQADKANVYPYFIGVFDTVAALGRPAAFVALTVGLVLIVALLSLAVSLLSVLHQAPYVGWILSFLVFEWVFSALTGGILLAGAVAILRNYIKYDFHVPGYGWLKSIATIHIAAPKQKFTDYSLNPNVTYAKHAISIDENRRDFKRVKWSHDEEKAGKRDAFDNLFFEQVWFSGVHADIGGGYSENESRLSDVTLRWMLAAASIIPNGIEHDERVLSLHPNPLGPQHDEYKAGRWQKGVRELPADKNTGVSVATMHKSVYERFQAPKVNQYDTMAPYRPENLKNHADFMHYYNQCVPKPSGLKGISDGIEARWEECRNRASS